MNDSDDTENMIAALYHASRTAAKSRRKVEPKGSVFHHRANTDWWNFVDKKKR